MLQHGLTHPPSNTGKQVTQKIDKRQETDTIPVNGGSHTEVQCLYPHREFGTDLGFVEVITEPTDTRGEGVAAAHTHPPAQQRHKAHTQIETDKTDKKK